MGSTSQKNLAQKKFEKYLAFSLRVELAYIQCNLVVICKYLYIGLELCKGGCMYMRSEYLDHKPHAELMHCENPPNWTVDQSLLDYYTGRARNPKPYS